MKSPGITIKPLRQITGESHFNEVFMDDLRVPRENLIGKLNDGWHVANTTLANERGTGALALLVRFGTQYQEVVDLARSITRNGRPAVQDPIVRQRLAEFYIDLQRLKYTVYRGFSAIIKGGTPGPEGSIQKVVWSELSQRMQEFAVELQGPAAQLAIQVAARDSQRIPSADVSALARGHNLRGDFGDPAQYHRPAGPGPAADQLIAISKPGRRFVGGLDLWPAQWRAYRLPIAHSEAPGSVAGDYSWPGAGVFFAPSICSINWASCRCNSSRREWNAAASLSCWGLSSLRAACAIATRSSIIAA